MARVRISTTVDESTLHAARAAHGGGTDASLIEAALAALLAQHRRATIDAAYATAYASDAPGDRDEWGELGEWHAAVAAAKGPRPAAP